MIKLVRLLPLFALLTILSLSACNDDSAPGNGAVPATFTKKVVVEKFTGEWCGSCPAASRWMDDMSAEHGNKFIAVGIHSGSQHDRYKDNPACKTMFSFLYQHLKHPGLSTIGFPNVMIGRSMSPTSNQVINGYSRSQWPAKTAEELAKTVHCGLAINSSFSGDKLNVTVKYHLKKALGPDHAITVYVTENDLDGSEQVSGGAGFKHKHTLRGLLTDKSGDAIDGTAVDQTMEMTFDGFDCTGYNKDKLEVIAFIHHLGSDYSDREIVNGQIAHAGSDQDFD